MQNEKQVLWEQYLNERSLMDGLEFQALDDENATVVYRGGAETSLGIIPMYIILDNTYISTIRFSVGENVVTPTNLDALVHFCNRQNSEANLAKFYVEEGNDTIYLDLTYIACDSDFNPDLLFGLLRGLLEYLKEVSPQINDAILGVKPEPKEKFNMK